jgi:hypothetical protein
MAPWFLRDINLRKCLHKTGVFLRKCQEHREDSLRLKFLLTKREHWQGEEQEGHAIVKQNPTTDSSLGQAGLDLSYETKKKVSTP